MNNREISSNTGIDFHIGKYCAVFRKRFSDVRISRWCYMLIFTHAPLFANMGGNFFTRDPMLLGLDAESWMRISYCLGAAWLIVFATMNNIRLYAKVLSLCATLLFFSWVFVTNGVPGVLLASGFAFFYGGCGGLAIFHFVYMLNDSERFLGATATSLFYTIFQFDFSLGLLSSLFNRTYMMGLVLVTLACMLSYRKEDYAQLDLDDARLDSKLNKQERGKVRLTFYFFFAYHIVEMFYTYMQGNSDHGLILVSGIGGAIVIITTLFLFFFSRFNLWHMSNLFFLTMFMSYILLFWKGSEAWLTLSRAFHGGEQIGFISSYCMLWGILQTRVGFKKFKIIVVCTLNVFFFVYAFLGKAVASNLEALPLLSCVLTFCMFMIFLLLSPSYAYTVFDRSEGRNLEEKVGVVVQDLKVKKDMFLQEGDGVPVQEVELSKQGREVCENILEETDKTREDMVLAELEEKEDVSAQERMAEAVTEEVKAEVSGVLLMSKEEIWKKAMDFYKLTERERQVCHLLLTGYSTKEIAAELDISVDTVKFHVKNIYKKIGNSGKSALFATFNNFGAV
ncbi:MAG: LuxR C-terminal-related transcriptional regulator [Filifactor alocis]|nr:LuxR C-terminal-related transcriptional regulator [Filifactor alocis]